MSGSYRFDATPLHANGYQWGFRGLGVPGSDIPATGANGPSVMYNDINPTAEATDEFRFRLTSAPAGFVMAENGAFSFPPAADGTYTATGILSKNGVDLGPETITLQSGAGGGTFGSTVTGVTVSPAAATGSVTFGASVAGTGSPSQAVTWSIASGPGSINASTGAFTAPAATSSVQTTVVRATSVQDGTKSGTATVTVAASSASPSAPTVTGVTVSPGSARLAGGGVRVFGASVTGTNAPSQAVSWTASLGSIDGNGQYTAPAASADIQVATITATSVLDGSKSGSASVTIEALGTEHIARTVNVTVMAADQQGNPVAGAEIDVTLDRTDVDELAGYVVPEQITTTADADGMAVLALWPNALGTLGSLYEFKITNPDTGKILCVSASLPDADCYLHQVANPPT
jgi:hypothetical protein